MDIMSIDDHNHDREHDHDHDHDHDQDHDDVEGTSPDADLPRAHVLLPKRKGGRKPIYATSEERKQRNRQAQAAFRERRTEYIKQLEDSIRVHETNLQSLQTAHRSAADECLMLRYKNSLLERILLEKGIDVQAELRAKTGSPHLGPSHLPPILAQQPPAAQRLMLNRQSQARRLANPPPAAANPSSTTIAPKLETRLSFQGSTASRRPSSLSQTTTPCTPSPGLDSLSTLTTPTTLHPSRHPSLAGLTRPPLNVAPSQRFPRHARSMSTSGLTTASLATPYYQLPTFQQHVEQLEHEYEQHESTIDDDFHEDPEYADTFASASLGPVGSNLHGYAGSLLDPFDPLMDTDPFGLSKSLQFPGAAFYEHL